MTDSLPESTVPAIKNQLKSRLIFLAIVAIFVLPFFVLPLIMSPEQMNKTNKGTLIQPSVSFADMFTLNKKWSMVYVVPAVCDAACLSARTNALYSMRQVRLSLQRDMDRVQSLLVFTATPEDPLRALLKKEFPNTVQIHANGEDLDKRMAGASTAGNIYLMSPDGYMFIYYPPYENEKESIEHADDIRADLKKSIKGSRL